MITSSLQEPVKISRRKWQSWRSAHILTNLTQLFVTTSENLPPDFSYFGLDSVLIPWGSYFQNSWAKCCRKEQPKSVSGQRMYLTVRFNVLELFQSSELLQDESEDNSWGTPTR